MMVGQDVSSGINEKACAKDMNVYGTSIAFGGHEGISVLIHLRLAICVEPGKPELCAAFLIVKAENRIDKTHAVGVIPDDLLRDTGLALEFSDTRISLLQAAIQIGKS